MVHFARPGMEHRNRGRCKQLKNRKLQNIMISAFFLTILRAVRRKTDFQRFPGEIFNLADRIFRFFILYVLSFENIIKKEEANCKILYK